MNIYLLTRKDEVAYGEYTAYVVVARSKKDAVTISPSGARKGPLYCWSSKENIDVSYIGKAGGAIPRGVVLASFIGS